MAPFHLQGLNVVQPPYPDNHDLASPFPDFSAHLDLWTNLAFESDEPLASSSTKRKLPDDELDAPPPNRVAHEGAAPAAPHPPPLDINALLAGLGIDPLLMLPPPFAPHPVPSIAQLLALHATHPPSSAAAPSPPVAPPSSSPPSKRARAQKLSSSTDSTDPNPSSSTEELTQSEPLAPALSPAEDKRRRNTAASARFRLKKKEREAALEHRAKELEDRVVELERECETLRRENGWLKGLVIGVTGAGAAQHQQAAAK